MTFIALGSEGALREQQMALVPCDEAVRCLGVWFSFLGPAGHADGRWAHQIKKLTGVIASFFEKCSSLHHSFAQMSEVLESTLIRRLLFPIQSGVPAWHLLGRVRGLTSQWIHRTLGFCGSATGNDNVAGARHTPRICGGLGIPGIMSNIYRMHGIDLARRRTFTCPRTCPRCPTSISITHQHANVACASDPHTKRTICSTPPPSLNRLFSLNNAGIRIHSGSGGSIHPRKYYYYCAHQVHYNTSQCTHSQPTSLPRWVGLRSIHHAPRLPAVQWQSHPTQHKTHAQTTYTTKIQNAHSNAPPAFMNGYCALPTFRAVMR